MRQLRLAALVAAIGVLGLGACSGGTGPSSPLDGSWRTIAIPSGSGIGLSLVTSGGDVSGNGQEYVLQNLGRSIVVSGRSLGDATFRLNLTFDDGTAATYNGRMSGSDQLTGTWSVTGQAPRAETFYRQ